MSLGILWEDLRARGVIRRAGICLAAYIIALNLAIFLPIPDVWFTRTPTGAIFDLLVAPWPGPVGCDLCQNQGGFRTYFEIASLLAAVVAQPVLTYQLLALASPPPANRLRLLMITFATLVSFTIGVLFGYIVVLPLAIRFLLDWGSMYLGSWWVLDAYIGTDITWQFSLYIRKLSAQLVHLGLAFEMPALLAGLVWLGILTPHRPAS